MRGEEERRNRREREYVGEERKGREQIKKQRKGGKTGLKRA